MVVLLDLRGKDEATILRLLRALLKRLGRTYGVRCRAAALAGAAEPKQ